MLQGALLVIFLQAAGGRASKAAHECICLVHLHPGKLKHGPFSSPGTAESALGADKRRLVRELLAALAQRPVWALPLLAARVSPAAAADGEALKRVACVFRNGAPADRPQNPSSLQEAIQAWHNEGIGLPSVYVPHQAATLRKFTMGQRYLMLWLSMTWLAS